METYVAIDNVCAWPNLKLLPDGDVLAFLFNRPSHGREEGDVECWASRDGGVFWERRNVVTHHEPGTNRMNHAVGLNRRGELIVAVSGWKLPLPNTQDRADSLMPAYVYGSADGGRTWAHLSTLPTLGGAHTIPFGDIVTLPDGVLAMSVYGPVKGQDGVLRNQCSVFFSPDDGRTWGAPALLGMDRNETVLLALGGDRLIAAARTYIPWEATPPGTGNWGLDQHIALHTSKDAGRTWRDEGALTLPGQHPGGLVRVADGRILLVYGMRNPGYYGVAARFGSPDGRTWGPPLHLTRFAGGTDGGYPSSVQLADGTIVTAYYANRTASHQRYQMGVIRWKADEALP